MQVAELAIIDGGGANLTSLQFALSRLGVDAVITTDAATIEAAERAILPGVGAAKNAMQTLQSLELCDVIRNLRQPVLGICLGMQLLAEGSAEENTECLGIMPGVATRLAPGPSLPVPNMGWCPIDARREHPLLAGIDSGTYFYFVHSYALPVADATLASAAHSSEFTAVAAHGNFVAAQFHPERSAGDGARLLQNFLRWVPCD